MRLKITKEVFYKKATEKYGNKYNYDLSQYIDYHKNIPILCIKHNHLFYQRPAFHLKDEGCRKCFRENLSQIKKPYAFTIEEFIKKSREIHGDKYTYNLKNPPRHREKISIICNTCKNTFSQIRYAHLRGQGCPNGCHDSKKVSIEEWKERAIKIFGNYYDYSLVNYKCIHDKVPIICPKHGIFSQRAITHTFFQNGCPLCARETHSSKGVKNIEKLLKENQIDFIREHKFPNCKNILPLPFDFYLPSYNVCIEYDGQQHFEPRYGEKTFKKTLFNDNIKNEFCKNNNITLFRIPYNKLVTEEIEKIMIIIRS